ncbi:probable fructose-2,6-bisphosphatase TIGAR A isoform X1 [Osmerus mordax]|uniref:probable fructose-2,6-bisphosphatase TIGAR A isoform X1 n=2 Tax=Osmerus mordax TaxID=8014 RepID=UPI00350EF3AA
MLTFGLTIVRHGETQYNKDGLLQGQAIDSPLSEIGMAQAEAVGQYLRDITFTNIFVSSMLRARQTAEMIVKHNSSCSGLEMVSDALLKERSFGIAEGGRVEDLRNMARAAGETCPDFTPPEGETQEQVKERFKAFLETMFQRMMADHCSEGQQRAIPLRAAMVGTEDSPEAPPGQPDDGLQGTQAHTLIVGHGAYIRVAVRYMVEELQCSLPAESDMTHVLSLCPNTGIGRFVLTVTRGDAGTLLTASRCVFVNRRDHIKDGE